MPWRAGIGSEEILHYQGFEILREENCWHKDWDVRSMTACLIWRRISKLFLLSGELCGGLQDLCLDISSRQPTVTQCQSLCLTLGKYSANCSPLSDLLLVRGDGGGEERLRVLINTNLEYRESGWLVRHATKSPLSLQSQPFLFWDYQIKSSINQIYKCSALTECGQWGDSMLSGEGGSCQGRSREGWCWFSKILPL